MKPNPEEQAPQDFFISLAVDSPILIVEQVSKQHVFNLQLGHQAPLLSGIQQISFSLKQGEVLAVIGESGSGKSTLLKSIYGLLDVDAGQILFEGKKVKGPSEQLVPGHPDMRLVAQDFALNPYAKVYDNVASMLSNTDVKAKREKTLELLSDLQLLELKDKKAVHLSGGEQQRVAIAKALISPSKMLLFDEPFSQIDSLLKNQIRQEIKRIAKTLNKSIILVSHDPSDGLSLADQLIILRKGECLAHGTTLDLYDNPPNLYTAEMLGNAQSLAIKEAEFLGLNHQGKPIYFYPEWVKIVPAQFADQRALFEIKDIAFKGAHQELTLQLDNIRIRAYSYYPIRYKKSDLVALNISRFQYL